MFASSQMMPLFSVPVWAQVLEDETAQTMNEHLLQQVDLLKADLPAGVRTEDGWQTRTDLHTLDAFSGMTAIIGEASKRVLEMLKVAPTPYEITGCWMNIKPRGTNHPLHSHQNNYLSGVYYVQAPEGADSISFHDTRTDRQIIVPRYTEDSPLTATSVHVPVKPGVMIMFPSWLQHSVQPNPTEEIRVSLSFNIMFSDFAKTQSVPAWDWAAEEQADPSGS